MLSVMEDKYPFWVGLQGAQKLMERLRHYSVN